MTVDLDRFRRSVRQQRGFGWPNDRRLPLGPKAQACTFALISGFLLLYAVHGSSASPGADPKASLKPAPTSPVPPVLKPELVQFVVPPVPRIPTLTEFIEAELEGQNVRPEIRGLTRQYWFAELTSKLTRRRDIDVVRYGRCETGDGFRC
jgi:hypothetical protein